VGPVLVGEQHQVAGGIRAGRAAGLGQQDESEQRLRLGLIGQQPDEHAR
jgi:hypothetical protein